MDSQWDRPGFLLQLDVNVTVSISETFYREVFLTSTEFILRYIWLLIAHKEGPQFTLLVGFCF